MVFIPRWTPAQIEPRGPFVLNKDSPQAQGLVFWVPCHPLFGADAARSAKFDRSLWYRQGTVLGTNKMSLGRFNDGTHGFALTDGSLSGVSFASDYKTNMDGASRMSMMARFNWATSGSTDTIFGRPDQATHSGKFWQYALIVRSNSEFMWFTSNGTTFSRGNHGTASADTDYHFAGTFNSDETTEKRAYVDGAEIGSNSFDGVMATAVGSPPVRIGSNASDGERWPGVLADLRIYDWTLPPALIAQAADPGLRFDLYHELGRVIYFPLIPAAAAGVTGTIAQTLPFFTQAVAGDVVIAGTAAQTLPFFTQAVAGDVPIAGTAAQTLPFFTQAVAGDVPVAGTAAQTLPFFTQAAAGDVPIAGTAAQTLPFFTQVVAGDVPIAGTAAQTLPFFTQSASGTIGDVATGTIAQTLPFFTQAASGQVEVDGTAAQTLPFFTQAVAGDVPVAGTAAQTLPFFSQAANANAPIAGTAAQTLPFFSQAANANASITGTAAQTLPFFSQAAAGAVAVGGTAAQTLPFFGQAANGNVPIAGAIAQTLPFFMQAAVGTGPSKLPAQVFIQGIHQVAVTLGGLQTGEDLAGTFDHERDLAGRTEAA